MPQTDGLGDFPIRVIEIFGPTIQGEGMYAGTLCTFIRTAGCDNRCAWCDTKYAQDESAGWLKAYEDTAFEAYQKNTEVVVITGGNPALQPHLDKLVRRLQNYCHRRVHIETQGTIWRDCFRYTDHVTVSPKPPSSTNPLSIDSLAEFIRKFGNKRNFELKVVVFDYADLIYAAEVRERYLNVPMTLQVGNPSTTSKKVDAEDLLEHYRKLIELCYKEPILKGVRILPQLHTLIYGNEKGK